MGVKLPPKLRQLIRGLVREEERGIITEKKRHTTYVTSEDIDTPRLRVREDLLLGGNLLHDLRGHQPLADAAITTWFCLRDGYIYIVSLEDGNMIFKNDERIATLNRFQRASILVSAGDRIYALKPISASHGYGSSNPSAIVSGWSHGSIFGGVIPSFHALTKGALPSD